MTAVAFFLIGCDCGEHLSASTGIIQSPDYPGPYPPNCSCEWTVSIDDTEFSEIKVKFRSVDLQLLYHTIVFIRHLVIDPSDR